MLDAAAHELRKLPGIHLEQLPRMADFALWATACEKAFWPAGTFVRAYRANRKAALEDLIDADPVAACVREIMAKRNSWSGSAADLLRAGGSSRDGISRDPTGWPKNPRALAGRLRRAQPFLRALGIQIAFSREGRAGTRVIRIYMRAEDTATTASTVSNNNHHAGLIQSPPGPVGAPRDDGHQPALAPSDDADGADAYPAVHFT